MDRHGERPRRLALSRTTGYLIRRAQQVHNALWAHELGGEVTSPQYAVLAVLAAWPNIDQRRLGELASLDKSSVADIVGRLASRQWIARQRDPRDGRRKLVDLSPAAAIAVDQLTLAALRVQERFVAPIPADDRASLIDNLRKVVRLDAQVARHTHPSRPPVLDLSAPGHLIRRAQQVHTAFWTAEFAHELTGPQFAVLYVAAQWDGLTQRQVGELAALDKSTAAGIVSRLAHRGLLQRQQDPHDGRGNVIAPTADGHRVMDAFAGRVSSVQERLLEPLSGPSREGLLTALARIAFPEGMPDMIQQA